MSDPDKWVVVGLDNGGTTNNATVLDSEDRFLVDRMVETPSYVREGPEKAIEALALSLEQVLELTGTPREIVRAVGLDTPGPVSARRRHLDPAARPTSATRNGAASTSAGRWSGPGRHPGRVQQRRQRGGAVRAPRALRRRWRRRRRSSVSAIVGTGLGGGVIEAGQVVQGAAGMAGELGHVWIPMDGLLGPGQPVPGLQLRPVRRRRERRLADRDREEPAAVLADPVPRPRARPGQSRPHGGEAGPRVRRGRRPAGAGDLHAAGDGDRPAVHDRRQLHRPGRVLRRRRRGRGGAAASVTGSWTGCASTRPCARSRNGPRAIALVPDLDMAGARGSAIAASAAVR